MKKVYILLTCILLLPKLVWAQYYIELNKNNTFHYKNSYLIDIPTNYEYRGANLLIQDPKHLIPLNAYSEIYLNETFNRLDTIFISRMSQVGKNGLTKDVLKKNIIPYFLGRYNINNPMDTLMDVDNRFENYKTISKSNLPPNSKFVLIYFVEMYGGMPRSTRSDNKISLSNFITEFEKKHHAKVGEFFSTSLGHEGDVEIYSTLSGLNSKLKLQFIRERELSLLPSDSKKDKDYIFKIYTPYFMDISGFQIRVE
ncbi:hypothetical protein [Mucilaginibacter sp.]